MDVRPTNDFIASQLSTGERELPKLAVYRVKRGAKFMDKKLPGWFVQVDPDKLTLHSDCNCVFGQLACDIVPRATWFKRWRETGTKPQYTDVAHHFEKTLKLSRSSNFFETHGFIILGCHEYFYADLTEAWKREINARKREMRAA